MSKSLNWGVEGEFIVVLSFTMWTVSPTVLWEQLKETEKLVK